MVAWWWRCRRPRWARHLVGLAQITADELPANWKTVSVEPALLVVGANRYALGEMTTAGVSLRMLHLLTTDRVVEYFLEM
jgi:hypothetical protein